MSEQRKTVFVHYSDGTCQEVPLDEVPEAMRQLLDAQERAQRDAGSTANKPAAPKR